VSEHKQIEGMAGKASNSNQNASTPVVPLSICASGQLLTAPLTHAVSEHKQIEGMAGKASNSNQNASTPVVPLSICASEQLQCESAPPDPWELMPEQIESIRELPTATYSLELRFST